MAKKRELWFGKTPDGYHVGNKDLSFVRYIGVADCQYPKLKLGECRKIKSIKITLEPK